jgi:protein-disulfide isomerase
MDVMQLLSIAIATIAVVLAGAGAPSAQSASSRAVGPVTAAVRIDLFSDFQCPACKALHEQTIKRIKADYARQGKVRLVHHDFPLPQHQFARQAATLAAAADRLGKFDAVSDALFLQQDSWSKTGNVEAVVDSVLSPEERKKLRAIAKDPAIATAIDRDVELGKRSQVSSTPTMIITHNGSPSPIVGVVTYSVVSRYIDSLLAKSK